MMQLFTSRLFFVLSKHLDCYLKISYEHLDDCDYIKHERSYYALYCFCFGLCLHFIAQNFQLLRTISLMFCTMVATLMHYNIVVVLHYIATLMHYNIVVVLIALYCYCFQLLCTLK